MITEEEHSEIINTIEVEIEEAKDRLEQLEDDLESAWQMNVEESFKR